MVVSLHPRRQVPKTRSFSVFLLKPGFAGDTALEESANLEECDEFTGLPEGSSIYILDNPPYPPWWRSYFGISEELTQATKGALVFLPVGQRCFALAFGHVQHNLKEEAREHDFGLRVTLNSVDPNELRSTDLLDPGASRRKRVQVPIGSALAHFEFDRDSTIVKSLTGRTKAQHTGLFKQATGASNLRIGSSVNANELQGLCEKLLTLYDSEDYKETFKDIQNVVPVRDPETINALNGGLVAAVLSNDSSVSLVIPDIIHYASGIFVKFIGAGRSEHVYPDVFMGSYREYLEEAGFALTDITIEKLKKHRMILCNQDGEPVGEESYSIYKSLVWDSSTSGETYHLSEGAWYRVDRNYITSINTLLDRYWTALELPPYVHQNEGMYNIDAAAQKGLVCLDRGDISPSRYTQVEPCDLLGVQQGNAVFYHVKISTLSSELSHLFNQGSNSVELIRGEPAALIALKDMLGQKGADSPELIAALDENKYQVVFAIATHKNATGKAENLPLFSRISLARNVRRLRTMAVEVQFGFIEDARPPAAPAQVQRRRRGVPRTP